MPHVYEHYRQAMLEPDLFAYQVRIQNQDGIVHLRAEQVEALTVSAAQVAAHDFH
jgi:error-prone DNA polymerase